MVISLHQKRQLFRASNETTIIGGYTSAPRSATEATFLFNPKLAKIGELFLNTAAMLIVGSFSMKINILCEYSSTIGYSSIAAPGFLHGIWTALKRFGSGRIGWMDLLMPSVYLVGRGGSSGFHQNFP
uniref:AA_permease domain-containing protein n=1 Tax=Angiostrongylus cantonensis TaxID=6313 RepID=A0A0K0DF78_ANGCA